MYLPGIFNAILIKFHHCDRLDMSLRRTAVIHMLKWTGKGHEASTLHKELKNVKSRRNDLPQGGVLQLFTQYQMDNHENRYTNNIMQTEQVI